jgi:hypothetical protein
MTTNQQTYMYRMAFPIEDDTMRVSQVINSALLIFPEVAEERGIKVTGNVNAWIDGDRVHCEAAAEIIEGRTPRLADLHGWRVAALLGAGLNDRQIAEELGLDLRKARRIRVELGMAPTRKHAKAS